MRAGVHPKTGKALDLSVGLDGRSIGEITKASGTYSNLPAYRKKPAADEQQPSTEQLRNHEVPPARSRGEKQPEGKSARQKSQEMLERVTAKEKAAAIHKDDPQPEEEEAARSEGRSVGKKHRR